MALYLHDRKVTLIGVGPMGTWVEDEEIHERHCVFAKGKEVYRCVGKETVPVPEPLTRCPRCSWRRIKEVIKM